MASDRTALIVGASRGIGLGVAAAFLKAGYSVIATARRPGQATGLTTLLNGNEGRLTILALDMNDPQGLDGFAAQLKGRSLDVALVNAGVAGPAHRSANAATEQEIGALMFTNAVAPIRLARSLVPLMRKGSGVLAFQSSVMGSVALNSGGHELYRASKAALNSLTRGLWQELRGKDLTVLSLHPGWVRTDMGGAGAPVPVEESADGIVRVIEANRGAHQHRYLDYKGAEIAW